MKNMNAKTIAIQKKNNTPEKELIEKALSDEYEAIDIYERILSKCDNEKERKIFEEILKDEEDHSRLLIKIKKGETSKEDMKGIE